MIEIQIIKVEDPGCLWGRVLKGHGVQPDSPEEYNILRVKMNLFYHEFDLDIQKLKPAELKEGLVCVVFSPILKCWCRAVIESLFQGTAGGQAMCFLVDYGDRISIKKDDVRTPLEKFLQLPFRVRRFKLAGIRPMTLQVSIFNETAELVPSSAWDSSATKYLYNLLQVSTLVEAVLCETDTGCSSIELYLTINNTKICVNHELVVKKFACFWSEKSSTVEVDRDRTPVSLAWDIYSSPHQLLEMNGCCPVKSPATDIFMRKERKEKRQTEKVQQKPQELKQTDKLSQVNPPDVPDLAYNAGTYTFGKGWRLRAEPTDIFTDDPIARLQYKRFIENILPPKHVPDCDGENQNSTDNENRSASAPDPQDSPSLCASDSSEQKDKAALSYEPSLDDQLAASRLLQFLNPEPLNLEEHLEARVVRSDPGHAGVLWHSGLPMNPCTNLTRAPITEHFRKFLLWKKYNGPNVGESYCWPAVARGCDTVLVSHSGDSPLSYIPPLLMLLQMVSDVSNIAARTGPVAVILCPGWEKVQTVLDLLEESKATQSLHPTSVILGVDQNEPNKIKIQRNCQLLVTTPFTMMRLLDAQRFLFLRLCHLVLDEADVLYSQAPEQLAVILKHFQRVVSGEERVSCPRQIIAVGSHWSAGMEVLVRDHMIYPSIIITVMEEAALYGKVHQTVHLCLDCDKISVLLSFLDLNPPKPQKTLIITNSKEDTEHVYKAVVNTAVFTLKAHEDVTDQFDFVIDQWRKDIGPGTQVVLVTTNDCLKALGIRDATCVVHYGFPSSPKLFGSRLFCMSKNFRNLSEPDHDKSSSPTAQSVLLLSEQNAPHVCGVLRYLKRAGALLPPELLQFALGVQQAKEEQKANRPLCCSLKSFGFCRDNTVCPDRHTINNTLDGPLHPDSGSVMVLPLYIKTACVYFGRLVSQKDDVYEALAAQMKTHYSSERRCAVEAVVGELYAVQEEDLFHRVRVIEVPDKGERMFSSVIAYFIDEGRTQEVKSHQLLQLPPEFQDLADQAVEIILCRAQPIDGEVDWNPKVTRAISLKIKRKLHQAKVVMCVGNAVWVDPMVRMTRVPGLKICINEYNVHNEILASGFGVNNPQHLDLLKRVFHGEDNATTLDQQNDRSESSSESSPESDHNTEVLCETSESPAVCQEGFNSTDVENISEANVKIMSQKEAFVLHCQRRSTEEDTPLQLSSDLKITMDSKQKKISMAHKECHSCKGPIQIPDSHDDCVICLDLAHAEAVLSGSDCPHCEDMTVKVLKSHLALAKCKTLAGSLPPPAAIELRRMKRCQTEDELTLGEYPSPKSPVFFTEPHLPPSSSTSGIVSLCASKDSFKDGAMSMASSDKKDSSRSTPNVAPNKSSFLMPKQELLRILTKAVEDLGLECSAPAELTKSCLHTDDSNRSVPLRSAPFFPEVHEELSKSWKAPLSARDVTSGPEVLRKVDGSDKWGYEKLPPIEEAIASHLCPVSAMSRKSAATLPSKPCRTTARMADKAFKAAGQAASALHTMAVLQVYQAKMLKALDEVGPDSEVFRELRITADLAIWTIRIMAQSVGRSMSSLVVLHRHLWLTLTDLKDAERNALLDAPVCATGLFGDAAGTLDWVLEAQKQSTAISRFLPRRSTAPSDKRSGLSWSHRTKKQHPVKQPSSQASRLKCTQPTKQQTLNKE